MRKVAKFSLFLLLVLMALLCCQKIMTVPGNDYRNYQWVRGFYKEPKNSLDMVFIGGSNIYAFLEPPFIFRKYGFTSWSFATNSQPVEIAEFLLKEARKRQPDALYIINMYTLVDKFSEPQMHYILDHLPLSKNKLSLTHYMLDFSGYKVDERAEFYVPIVRYHSRWKSLKKADFTYRLDGFKSGSTYNAFLEKAKDVSNNFIIDESSSPLPKKIESSLRSLLDYCDENHVRVMFLISPRADKQSRTMLQRANSAKRIITERGYTVLDLVNSFNETGIDLKTDFYNEAHTNIHGAIKTEDAVIRYVKEHYDFEDKRNDVDFSDWNKAAQDYLAFVDKYLTDKEKEFFDITPPRPDNVSD